MRFKGFTLIKSQKQKQNKLQIFDHLHCLLKQLQKSNQYLKEKMQKLTASFTYQLQNHSQFLTINKEFLLNSSIIDKKQQCNKIIQLLPSKLKGVKLIYKASENEFSVSNYLKEYGSQTHTLFICKNNKDKILGGYSPLSHLYSGKEHSQQYFGEYVEDQSMTSFIFSLTENDKFELKDKKKAVCRYKSKDYIGFGVSELKIGDKSDINKNSNTLINIAYCNSKYKSGGEDSYIRLNGNGNGDQWFLTKEWQVWKIELKEQVEQNQIIA